MYLDFLQSLNAQLRTNNSIVQASGGNIIPLFRGNLNPCIVTSSRIDDADRTYQQLAAVKLEVTIQCSATPYSSAVALSNLVFDFLDNTSWQDATYRVLGCFFRDSDEMTNDLVTQNMRMTTIDMVFDLTVQKV